MSTARLPNVLEDDIEGVSGAQGSRRRSAPVTTLHETEQSVAGTFDTGREASDGTVGEMHDPNTQSTLHSNGSEHTANWLDEFRAGMRGFEGLDPADIRLEDLLDVYDLVPVGEGRAFLGRLPDADLNDFPNDATCTICMEPFGGTEDSEIPVQLPCRHLVGRKCISRWLESKNSCPFCRRVLFGLEPLSGPEREAYAEASAFMAELAAIRREESALATRLENLERGNVRMSHWERSGELLRIELDGGYLAMRMQFLLGGGPVLNFTTPIWELDPF